MNISTEIESNKLHFDAVFGTGRNFDLKKRELSFAGKEAVLYMIDGFLRSDVLERILAEFSFLKKGDVAYIGTHRHDSRKRNEIMVYTYMYYVEVPVNEGISELKLPDDRHVVIFAATAVK